MGNFLFENSSRIYTQVRRTELFIYISTFQLCDVFVDSKDTRSIYGASILEATIPGSATYYSHKTLTRVRNSCQTPIGIFHSFGNQTKCSLNGRGLSIFYSDKMQKTLLSTLTKNKYSVYCDARLLETHCNVIGNSFVWVEIYINFRITTSHERWRASYHRQLEFFFNGLFRFTS